MTEATVATEERVASVGVRPASGRTTAVALVLPGGRADSFEATDSRQLAGLRMVPIAGGLHRRGARHGLAVWTVRYRYRGWNGSEMSPVTDTRWALDEVRRRHGAVPVVLVGHSMGGRTALRVADDDSVRAVAALAPWVVDSEPVDQLAGKDVLVMHGNLDVVTSPRASRRLADRAAAAGARVRYVTVRGDLHAMLLRWRLWHRLTVDFTSDVLGFTGHRDRWRGGSGKNPDVRFM